MPLSEEFCFLLIMKWSYIDILAGMNLFRLFSFFSYASKADKY